MSRKKRRFVKLKRFLFTITLIVFLFLGGWTVMLFGGDYLTDDAKIAELQQAATESSDYVRIEEMPEYLWEAFIAIEDHRFEQHDGVDLIALGRAVWVNTLEGSRAQGGSTVTMQLARNLFLTHDKEFTRKVQEMMIALHLERELSKEQILELYLNHIYFGHGKNGIETAAEWYFGKTAHADDPEQSTVTLGEAALLAALPRAPEHYSPLKDLDRALERRDLVLARMVDEGFITEDEKVVAMEQEISIVKREQTANNTGEAS